jgi:acyl-homoserine-lactone acylase
MLLADRVKPDLIAAVRASPNGGDIRAAIELLQRWDNTAAPPSRGGTLFEIWWRRYAQGARAESTLFARPWAADDPIRTPSGLADSARAVEAFSWAVEEAKRRFGSWDVAWGDVHRVRRGTVDVPVGGCGGDLGCFRVLSFRPDRDGKLIVSGGDGWVLAVEFTDVPRAYSVLAYGESARESSPHYSDQAEMFALGKMKQVAFSERDVEAQTLRRYRPGETKCGLCLIQPAGVTWTFQIRPVEYGRAELRLRRPRRVVSPATRIHRTRVVNRLSSTPREETSPR